MESSAIVKSIKRKNKHKDKKYNSIDDIGNAKKQKTGNNEIDEGIYRVKNSNIEIHSEDENNQQMTKKSNKSKKKKKKQSELEGKKSGEKSNRLLKREKEAHRKAEIMAAEQIQMKREAEEYLTQWRNDRGSWKFRKGKQVWLMKNKFDEEKVSEEMWPVFIEYFSTAMGNVKKYLIDDANKIIEKMEEWLEKTNEDSTKGDVKDDEDSESTNDKPSESVYRRARSIIQNITE